MSDDAATSPARAGVAYSGDIGQALSLLQLLYGDRYTFGQDPDRGFWVIENGKIGSLLTAPTPEALGGLIDTGTGSVS
jgi:hypothetical protein